MGHFYIKKMKINFKYSEQHNSSLEGSFDIPNSRITEAIQYMEKFWSSKGDDIESSLNDILNLKFTKDDIDCYITSSASFSDPLSLKVEKNKDMEDNLIHELIHVLLTQNYPHIKDKWDTLMGEYEEYHQSTKSHIPVHAIHYMLCKKLYPDRIPKIISYSDHPDYVVSWNVVLEEEPESIVSRLI